MTTIISSQRFIDNDILCSKIAALESDRPAEIVLQAWDVKDHDCAVLFNGHHTLEAARQLEIPVRFEVIDHPENIEGDNLLEQAWMDSDWYEVETGQLFF
jgi:hypothetical protein